MGNCVATIRSGLRRRELQNHREKSRKEDHSLLEEEEEEQHSFAIYIINNAGDIHDFYDVEEEKIGEGSFGRVVKCTNLSTGAERAVKMLRKVRRKSQLVMFQNELSTLKMLDHPHIVKLYEHFEDRKFMYIVMEYCKGGELFDRLLEAGHFTEGQAAIIMQQIFRGVYYLHTMKVVHRDLKIENFMFAGDGPIEANMIKIIDFGFARSFKEGETMKTKVGAPYFVSPQILAGKYTEATDMWTVGTVMYILLCGYPPFFGDSDAEILTRVRGGVFSFNDADWRHVTELAKDLIRGLLRMSEVERITAKQALFDTWIVQTAPVLRAPLKQKYFENMRKYCSFNKFKQASLQIIVSQLEPEILKPLTDTFMWLDSSGEGHIDADEIEAGMKRAGWTEVEMPEDLHDMVSGLDADGSGEIGLGEFVASVLDLQVYAREEVCWAVFRIYDQDGDGQIGVTDLMDILNNGQPDGQEVVSAHECRDLLKEADEDGDRRISFLEFLNMMKGTTDLSKVKKEKEQKKSAKLEAALQAGEDAAAELLEVTNEDEEPPSNVEAPELSGKPLEEADGTELPATEAAQEEPPVGTLGSDAAANSVDVAPESASQSAEGDSLHRGSQELALPALPAEHERRGSGSASEPPGAEAKAKKDKKEKKEKKAKKEPAATEAPPGEAEAAEAAAQV